MASVDESDQTQTSPVLSPFECTCQHASTTHAESCVVDQFCHQLIGTLVGGAADTLGNPELPNAGIAPLRPYLGASTRNSGAAAASYQRFYTAWRHQTRDEELDGELLKATKGRPELRTLVRRLIERTATWEGVGPEDANVLKAEWEKGADPGLLAKCLGSPHLGAPEKVKMASEVARNSWPPLEIADGWDRLSPEQIRATFDHLGPGETMVEKSVSVCGRVNVVRAAGSLLFFVDVLRDEKVVQAVFAWNSFEENEEVSESDFELMRKMLSRGDYVEIVGMPHRTERGELSILATTEPYFYAPCLRNLPRQTETIDAETKMKGRHTGLQRDAEQMKLIRLRSDIDQCLRAFLSGFGHVGVNTPILAESSGGAVAQPFNTTAAEFKDQRIALRIAPELWLKKLIIGGLDKVFEIGPCFRNEGIDLKHNPEFWTCEFYRTWTNLSQLMRITQLLLEKLSQLPSVIEKDKFDFKNEFKVIEFIPAIEKAAGFDLPDLDGPNAASIIQREMQQRNIPLPERPTLPRLLDKLCALYIEPECQQPTWIKYPPKCLSPLAKSFCAHCGSKTQDVALRAELFINGSEIINTYEEENSPVEQRIKFKQQLRYNRAENIEEKIDEGYLKALSSGMPPTGGWGCGMERLVMLFGATNRIADVMSFGTLKNVCAQWEAPSKDRVTDFEEQD